MGKAIKLYIGFGLFGGLLTFLFSLSANPITTTLIRSMYAFLTFAALAIGFHFVVKQLMHPALGGQAAVSETQQGIGEAIDLMTPVEEDAELSGMLKEQWSPSSKAQRDQETGTTEGARETQFQPLAPQRLVSLNDKDTDKVVQAIRRLTDE